MTKRLLDITLYSFISWLLILYFGSSDLVKNQIKNYILFQQSLPDHAISLLYFVAGLFTKNILINAGDYHNEGKLIKKLKSTSSNDSLRIFRYRFFANPPLKLSIFMFMVFVYFSSDTRIDISNFPELAIYFIGLYSPKYTKINSLLFKPFKYGTSNETESLKQTDWYQQEEPIKSTTQDLLNRTELISRMCDIIVNSKIKDSRGIALVASYGMGKSSVINMVIESINGHHDDFIICRIDAWGAYSSEEQIQKYIIEKIIKCMSSVVSTTNLSGLPSKYINSLKGAQSLWLDALPLFDNYLSPAEQSAQINTLLENVNHNILLIIEDLDRNKEAKTIFNSISPLIENLNGNGRIKFILSIGSSLDDPEIINRICRYKEFLVFEKNYIYDKIQMSVKTLLKESNFPYHCTVSHFFKKSPFNDSTEDAVRDALFSYISTPRDLKFILTQFSYDWRKSLKGSCDILDLLTITILKHYEEDLIKILLDLNETEIDFDKIKSHVHASKIKNLEAAEIIFKYFFKSKNKVSSQKRLQSCSKNFRRYFISIVNRSPTLNHSTDKERAYFEELYYLSNTCKASSNEKEILYSMKKILSYVDIETFMHDFSAINKKNTAIPLLVVYCNSFSAEKKDIKINEKTIEKIPELLSGSSVRNNSIVRSITKTLSMKLVSESLIQLASVYAAIEKNRKNTKFIYIPKLELIMDNFIAQGEREFNGEINYPIITLFVKTYFIISFKRNSSDVKYKSRIIIWMINNNSSLSKAMLMYIENFKRSNDRDMQINHTIDLLQVEMESFNSHKDIVTEVEDGALVG